MVLSYMMKVALILIRRRVKLKGALSGLMMMTQKNRGKNIEEKKVAIGLIGALGLGCSPLALPMQVTAAINSRVMAQQLSLIDGDVSIAEGSTKQLNVETTPANSNTTGLVWCSFNTKVALAEQMSLSHQQMA